MDTLALGNFLIRRPASADDSASRQQVQSGLEVPR
jgi:hypothetical protein